MAIQGNAFMHCRQCGQPITEFDLKLNAKMFKENRNACSCCLMRNQERKPYGIKDYIKLFITLLFPSIFFYYFVYNLILDNENCYYLLRELFRSSSPTNAGLIHTGEVIDRIIFPIAALCAAWSLISAMPFFSSIKPEAETYVGSRMRIVDTAFGGSEAIFKEYTFTWTNPILMILAVIVTILYIVFKMALGVLIFIVFLLIFLFSNLSWRRRNNVRLIKKYDALKKRESDWYKRLQWSGTWEREYKRKKQAASRTYAHLSEEEIKEKLWYSYAGPPLGSANTKVSSYYFLGGTWIQGVGYELFVDKKTGEWCISLNSGTFSNWARKRKFINKVRVLDETLTLRDVVRGFDWNMTWGGGKDSSEFRQLMDVQLCDEYMKQFVRIKR